MISYNERLHILRDSMYWGQNHSFFQYSAFFLNTSNLSIYEVSHCMKSSQYIERFNISSLSIYWDDLIQWETSYIKRFIVLRTKSCLFHFSDFVLNTLNLSIYSVSHCIKKSQYIERFNVSGLSLYQVISMYQKISTLNLACKRQICHIFCQTWC